MVRDVPLDREPRPEIVRRLRRIQGQVAGVSRMYEGGRGCTDVLDQLAPARAGLEAVALLTLEEHMDGCIRACIDGEGEREKARELVSAVQRFVSSI